MRVLIIDLYFPDFARLLRSRSQRDPVKDFRDYVAVREIVRRRGESPDDEAKVAEVLRSRGLAMPSGGIQGALVELDKEVSPGFPTLAQNPDFLALLDGLGEIEPLREKLRRFSPTTVHRPVGEVGRIFISCRRDDSAYAQRLGHAIRDRFATARVLLDVASLEPGVDWAEATRAILQASGVVLAILGPNWKGPWLDDTSNPFRWELAIALRAAGTRVIPVLVGGARLPSEGELPSDLAPLLRRNAAVLSDDRWNDDVERLIDAIEPRLSEQPASAQWA